MSDLEQYQMTKPAPMIWAHVITPRAERTVNGVVYPAGYEATFLFTPDHPDLAAIKKRLGAAAKAEFGRTDNLHYPLESGDKIADEAAAKGKDREFLRGLIAFKAKSNVEIKTGPKKGTPLAPPRLVVLQDGKYVRYSDEYERKPASRFFYSGVLAIGTFGFKAYTGMGGGVAAYLNEILSLNTGDKINTGVDDEAKYGPPTQYVGVVKSENPTVGMDDEISF